MTLTTGEDTSINVQNQIEVAMFVIENSEIFTSTTILGKAEALLEAVLDVTASGGSTPPP